MKRTRRRNPFFIAIVASMMFVALVSNWRGVWRAGIPARKTREARSASSNFRANADKDVRVPSATSSTPALQQFANFPLAFEANQGQADQRIKFLAREASGELQLSDNSVTLRSKRSALSFHFKGANGTPRVVGEEPLAERRNFLLGNDRSKWRTDVPTFRRVVYEQLYPGIDVS